MTDRSQIYNYMALTNSLKSCPAENTFPDEQIIITRGCSSDLFSIALFNDFKTSNDNA